MTKHEVKQEHKQTEGDPLIKSAIRSRQLAVARNRMMADVAAADVVLVNPTHVAVALKYDPGRGAPTVVAKGAGAVAAKIREKADEAEVPLVRDVPLARALYGSCQVGQEIPVELFAAVAQVLAFVIGRRTKGQRGGTHATPRADEALPTLARRRRRRCPWRCHQLHRTGHRRPRRLKSGSGCRWNPWTPGGRCHCATEGRQSGDPRKAWPRDDEAADPARRSPSVSCSSW